MVFNDGGWAPWISMIFFFGSRRDEGTFCWKTCFFFWVFNRKKQGVKRNEGAIFSCDDGTFFGGDIVWVELNFTPGKINMEPKNGGFNHDFPF